MFYCYLNLESTKTGLLPPPERSQFYCYLNLESTKTSFMANEAYLQVLLLLKS